MTFSIFGIDNEFAAATGDNVGVTEDTSRFDNPPSGSKDLVITTKPGDPDPRSFELGDTYEISWGGTSGGGFISDAVVVRSDGSPDGAVRGGHGVIGMREGPRRVLPSLALPLGLSLLLGIWPYLRNLLVAGTPVWTKSGPRRIGRASGHSGAGRIVIMSQAK